VGWFFGFKLHLVVNDQGEILAFCLTAGLVDDRHPVPKLAKGLVGKLFGDKGYLSQPLAQQLLVTQGLHLITKLRRQDAQPAARLVRQAPSPQTSYD
jgi:Transposase DDE domain